MSNSALFMLLLSEGIITFFTIYFFIKVLTVPPKSEPDSYNENDNIIR
jgi:hypothetical protein